MIPFLFVQQQASRDKSDQMLSEIECKQSKVYIA